ncbi:MAG: hypothetical protein Q8R10_11245 [Pseudomonas sp.]|uniref:hypothetical protein n=1 Tax=Pseudomonas sp. TaxID=306 RepID=UPI002734FC5A|nr:hypothetical protein [Pseudomonas sp.]MDP3846982.1 hypothetical protein [Pseudomonas sp.]
MRTYLLLATLLLSTETWAAEAFRVEHRRSSHSDWNTGTDYIQIETQLEYDGELIDAANLAELIEPDPEQRRGLQLFDAATLDAQNALTLFSRGSGEDYELAHLSMQGNQLQAKVLLKGLPNSWFTDARRPGWISLAGEKQLYMIQRQPLRIVDVGIGALLDVQGETALLADTPWGADAERNPAPRVRAVDLSSGKQLSELRLDAGCFVLPEFEFSHPQVYDKMGASTNQRLGFVDGPAWFARNLQLLPGSELQLRAEQQLPKPDPKRWGISLRQIDLGQQPRSFESLGWASSPSEESVDDNIDITAKDCSGINPNPYQHPNAEPYPSETLLADDLCLSDQHHEVAASERAKRCLLPVKQRSLAKGSNWELHELRYDYRPGGAEVKPQVQAQLLYQLSKDGQRYRYLEDASGGGEERAIREVSVIGSNDVLLKTRGSGPYDLWRTHSDANGQLQLDNLLESEPYPASPFDPSLAGWVYLRSYGLLIRQQPFAAISAGNQLLDIRHGWFYRLYVDDEQGNLHLIATPLNNPQQAFADAPTLSINSRCMRTRDSNWEFTVPPVNATLAESARWLQRNFSLSDDPQVPPKLRADNQLQLQASCDPSAVK